MQSIIESGVPHDSPYGLYPQSYNPKSIHFFASRSQNFFPREGRRIPEEYLQVLDMIQQRKSEVQKRREDIFVHPSVMPQTTPADIQRLRNKATHILISLPSMYRIILLAWA